MGTVFSPRHVSDLARDVPEDASDGGRRCGSGLVNGRDRTAAELMPMSRLRRLSRRVLRRTWVLRSSLRRIDRFYRPLTAKAKGDDRETLIEEHWHARADVEEQLEGIQTQRLLRRARRYYIVTPEIKLTGDDWEDENWARGWASGTSYLKPTAVGSLQRQVEDAKKRRRDAWEAWAKILGGLIAGLVALESLLVSAILAWKK